MTDLAFERHQDPRSSVCLGILRGQMQQLVDPPKMKPAFIFQAGSGRAPSKYEPQEISVLEKLQNALEEQLEEQEKWTKLTSKLERKQTEMDATVVRLTTSAKVFQDELDKRNANVRHMQEQLEEKKEQVEAQLNKILKDEINQNEQAKRSRNTADRAQEDLEEKQIELQRISRRLSDARKKLEQLEDRVESLQNSLRDNASSMATAHQRNYMESELRVERDHLDNFRRLVTNLEEEHNGIQKEVAHLKGKTMLFRGEHTRRTEASQSAKERYQEQKKLFTEKLVRYRDEINAVEKDRDEWAIKTNKLIRDVEPTKEKSAELGVKASLFRQQLQTIQTNVQRLQARILDFQDQVSERYVNEHSKESSSGRGSPVSVLKAPQVFSPVKPVSAPIWKPTTANPIKVEPVVVAKASTTSFHGNKANVKIATTGDAYSKNISVSAFVPKSAVMSGQHDTGLTSKVADLQKTVENQKRFQKECALKIEQQCLPSKLESLANHGGSVPGHTSKQKDQTQEDAESKELMQHMHKQVNTLSSKLETLSKDLHERDQKYNSLERRLLVNERNYAKQLEKLRSEMEQQLQCQKEAFAASLNDTVNQMQRAVMERRRGSLGNSSVASLESLYPMEGSTRNAQVTFEEEKGEAGPNIFLPAENGNVGLSMASGIMLNKPLFQNLFSAVGKSSQ